MPTSASIGKPWMAAQIAGIAPSGRVLDIGAGCGTYAHIVHGLAQRPAELVAVEVWEPYVATYGLEQLYDRVIVQDVRELSWQFSELTILGDVVEHLPREDAVRVVRKALEFSDWVLISLPITPWEQGTIDGNHHEAHLHHWSDDEMHREFDTLISASYVEEPIGCYLLQE